MTVRQISRDGAVGIVSDRISLTRSQVVALYHGNAVYVKTGENTLDEGLYTEVTMHSEDNVTSFK